MAEAVVQCLQAVCSSNNDVRLQAEQQIKFFESQSGYGVLLTQITLDGNLPVPIRQLASLALKKYVKEHWQENEETFVAPLVPDQDKRTIKQLLPSGLADPEGKIRTSVALAIASIAHWDWPDEWPNLIEDLVKCLQNPNNVNLVRGAIRCLDIFADGDNLSDQHLSSLFNLLFPPLYSIFANVEQYNDRIRTRVISIVYSLIKWLAIIKDESKSDVKLFFSTIAEQWISGFVKLLEIQNNSNTNDFGLKIMVVKVFTTLVNEFPGEMKKYTPSILGVVWQLMVKGLAVYEQCCVYQDTLDNTAQDSDGEVLSFESLVSGVLEFIHSIVERKAYKKLIANNITDLMYILIGYMQMTVDQEEQWTNDPDQYVADEEDYFNNYSPRLSAIALIEQLVEEFETDVLNSLSVALFKRLQESMQLKEQKASHWWKLREASIAAVGHLGDFICANLQSFDIQSFAQNVLALDLAPDATDILRARSLWCASQLSARMPTELVLPFVEGAAISLQTTNAALPVKMTACKAVGAFASKVKQEVIVKYLPTILTGSTALLPSAQEQTLHIVLDTLANALKIDAEVSKQYSDLIIQYVLAVWAKNANDLFITETITDIFDTLSQFPQCYTILLDKLIPVIATILKDSNELSGYTTSMISLLTSLVLHSPEPFPEPLLTTIFPHLIALLMRSEDSAITQEGAICLTAYIKKTPQGLVSWPKNPQTAFEVILQYAFKLLNPALPDYGVLYVGSLITALITKTGSYLGPFLPELLKAVVIRLQHAKQMGFIQALVLVFARLIHSHTKEVLQFLSELSLPAVGNQNNGNVINALDFVIQTWAKNQTEFHGEYHLKVSLTALVKLYQMNDTRINNIVVEGEKVANNYDGIVTRSKSKQIKEQYTQVPFKVKIIQVLVREYQVILETERDAVAQAAEGQDEDDEDEFVDLSDFLDSADDLLYGGYDEQYEVIDEIDEVDAKNDPINSIVIKDYIVGFLKELAKVDLQTLIAIGQQLNPMDQKSLQEICQ